MKRFGDEYKIQYDVVIDHNAYEFLRVSIEVDRENIKRGIVLLNGKNIGRLDVLGKRKYNATRFQLDKTEKFIGEFKNLGKATAAIISDLIV